MDIPIHSFVVSDETGCLQFIEAGDTIVPLAAWGCEFGNWYGFFSQEKMDITGAIILDKEITIRQNHVHTMIEVSLPEAHLRFQGVESLHSGKLIRTYRLQALEKSLLADFVIRSGFSCKLWPKAILGDKELFHRGKNSLFERDEGIVQMVGSFPTAILEPNYASLLLPLQHLTYVRDEPSGAWIVHQRVLTKNGSSDEYVFRMRHHLFSSYTCGVVGNRVFRKVFWRLAERFWGRIPTIQVGGNVIFLPGSEIELQQVISLQSRNIV